MTPKDYIVYVDPAGETRACLTYHTRPVVLIKEGNTIIGFVSSGSEADAIRYGNEVLRKD